MKICLVQISIFFKACAGAQSCPTLCSLMACGPPVSSVDGIFQARILDWFAISSFMASSQPRDQTHISRIAGRFCLLCLVCLLHWQAGSLPVSHHLALSNLVTVLMYITCIILFDCYNSLMKEKLLSIYR